MHVFEGRRYCHLFGGRELHFVVHVAIDIFCHFEASLWNNGRGEIEVESIFGRRIGSHGFACLYHCRPALPRLNLHISFSSHLVPSTRPPFLTAVSISPHVAIVFHRILPQAFSRSGNSSTLHGKSLANCVCKDLSHKPEAQRLNVASASQR